MKMGRRRGTIHSERMLRRQRDGHPLIPSALIGIGRRPAMHEYINLSLGIGGGDASLPGVKGAAAFTEQRRLINPR